MKTTERLSDLRSLDTDELGVRLKQARRELYELRFKLAVGQLENNREIRKARKDIARILTVIHQSRLEEGGGAVGQTAVAVAEVPGQEELAGAEARVTEDAPKAAEATGEKGEEEQTKE
jgi:large subunit ribosomal protein L29